LDESIQKVETNVPAASGRKMAKRSGIDSFVEHANAAYKKIFANFARLAALEAVTINTPFPSGCFIARKSATHPNSVEIEGALRLERVTHSYGITIAIRPSDFTLASASQRK